MDADYQHGKLHVSRLPDGSVDLSIDAGFHGAFITVTADEWAALVAAVGTRELEPHVRRFHADLCHGNTQVEY